MEEEIKNEAEIELDGVNEETEAQTTPETLFQLSQALPQVKLRVLRECTEHLRAELRKCSAQRRTLQRELRLI